MKNHSMARYTIDKLLTVLVLLSLLLPVRLAFACDLMDGETFNRCCCEDGGVKVSSMGGGCDLDDGAKTTAADTDAICCDVSVEKPPSYDSVANANGSNGLGALVEPSQPPPTLLTAPLVLQFAQANTPACLLVLANDSSPSSATLLVTQRIRI